MRNRLIKGQIKADATFSCKIKDWASPLCGIKKSLKAFIAV
jgi:hypothetical protein